MPRSQRSDEHHGSGATRTGRTLSSVEVLPNWPYLLDPQQYTSLAAVKPHAYPRPVPIDLNCSPRDPKTGAGSLGAMSDSVATTVSLPHPQQYGAPSCAMPQLNVLPAEISLYISPPATDTGTELDAVE